MSEYPQHDRLMEIRSDSQAIGAFLEITGAEGWHFMRWGRRVVDERLCPSRNCHGGTWLLTGGLHVACKGSGHIPVYGNGWIGDTRTIEQVLADYFGIDYQELQVEKDRMLANVRKLNQSFPK